MTRILIASDCEVRVPIEDGGALRVMGNVYMTTGRFTGRLVALRHLVYFALAVRAFFTGRRYDVLVCWQQFIGIYFAVLATLFRMEKPCVAGPLIYRPGGRLKQRLFQSALAYPHGTFVVFTQTEKRFYLDTFAVPQERIRVIRYGQKPSAFIEKHRNEMSVRHDVFSGGTSNRDYAVLSATAAELEVVTFSIACTPGDLREQDVPKNTRLVYHAYGDAFEQLLLQSKVVVIPLKPTPISSGQLVLFKAMQAGRPLIVPRVPTITEYLDDRLAFSYEVGDARSLADAIRRVLSDYDEALARALCARDLYFEKFAEDPVARMLDGLATGDA